MLFRGDLMERGGCGKGRENEWVSIALELGGRKVL